MRSFRILLPLALTSMILSACSANHKSIYRYKSLDGGNSGVVLVDAKQREILTRNSLVDANGKPDPRSIRLFCSAPSPDVFSVIAQSLSAGGSFGQQASPQSVQAALNLAFSSSETGSTIPRTQTINMLRELMFRTCERYLNGGIDELELSIQSIRDQRLMVSILAIEQLTGAVTPKPVIIGAAGSGGAGVNGEAIVRLDDARKAKEKADGDAVAAQTAFDEENGENKICDGIRTALADGTKPEDLSQAQKDKQEPCKKAEEKKTEALGKQAKATKAYTELSQLANAGGVTVATTNFAQGNGGLDRADVGKVKNVADAIETIVEFNFNDRTEVTLFCLRVLREPNLRLELKASGSLDKIDTTCIEYITKDVKAASRVKQAQIARSQAGIDAAADDLFEPFWTQYSAKLDDPKMKTKFVGDLVEYVGVEHKQCFVDAEGKPDYRVCFDNLRDPQVWRALAKGEI